MFSIQGIAHPMYGTGGRMRSLMSGVAQLESAIKKRLQPETKAWLINIRTLPSKHYILALDVFIKGLKVDGNWKYFDRLFIYVTEHQDNAHVSIVNPYSSPLTEVNSPTWDSKAGYTGNGSNMYLDLNYDPSIAGKNFSQDNASFGVYESNIIVANLVEIGQGTSLDNFIQAEYTSGQGGGTVNKHNGGVLPNYITWSNTASSGMFTLSRTDSSNIHALINGIEVSNATIVSTALTSNNFFVLAQPPGNFFSRNSISMAYIGSDKINQLSFYNRFMEFSKRIGANV